MLCKPSMTYLNKLSMIKESLRRRTKSFMSTHENSSSMSVMMKEDSSYLDNAVVSKSKARLFRELT